jgi:trk system potassium uptake protein TrkH
MFNFKIIIQILAVLLFIEGLFILLCVPLSILFHDQGTTALAVSGGICLLTGALAWFFTRNAVKMLSSRDGFLIVTLGWILFSLFGSLPFVISRTIPSFTDAFFETVSGFTTTGASILADIEAMPPSLLFWRSMTQWLGGMGIIVLSLAILPVLGIGGMQLFMAEVPGPTPDKLHPRIKETAKRLWGIYIIFTVAETILLWTGGMSLFDAVNHSFTTMATGGFSTRQASIAYWDSPFIHYVIIIFMFLAGTNFTLSYFALHLRFDRVFKNEEFKYYLGFLLGFTLITSLILYRSEYASYEASFRQAAFQVVSIVTTTGYVTADYLLWPAIGGILLFFMMFLGGSAGSTGGGIKIMRILLFLKNATMEMKRLIHPNAVIPVRFCKNAVSPEILSNVFAFISIYIITVIISVVVIAALGYDLPSSFGAVASSLGNIGPGFGAFGPAENFAHLPAFGKWYLSFLMLIGRLELFTVLLLLSPGFWRK